MIIELFFKLIFGLVDLFLSLIPDINLGFSLPDTSFFREILGMIDFIFPVGSLTLAIIIYLDLQNAQFVLKIFNFIIKKIPFFG